MRQFTDDDVPQLPAEQQMAEDEAIAEALRRGDTATLRQIAEARQVRARRAQLYGRLALVGSILAVLLAVAIVVFNLVGRGPLFGGGGGGEPAVVPDNAPTQERMIIGDPVPIIEQPGLRHPEEGPPPEDRFAELVAAAAQLTELPDEYTNGVFCNLAEPMELYQGVFVLVYGERILGSYPAFTNGNVLSIDSPTMAGEGWVHIPGRQPLWVEFDRRGGGTCQPDPILLQPGGSSIRGLVRNGEGQPEGRVWVAGCGGHALTDADGSYEMPAIPEPCQVRAYRLDGLLTARGEPFEVEPPEGGELVVDLSVPDWPTAGLGIAFRQVDGGFVIEQTVDGGDAAEQGLVRGDVILSIDGESTADMTMEQFLDLALGHEGSTVTLTIDSGGAEGGTERQVTLSRRQLSD